MTSVSPRCLVRGSINVDEFFALSHIVRPGETISSTSLTNRAGGKGANQANAVARAGGRVDLDGSIGQDGIWVKEMLSSAGVGVERLVVLDTELTGRAIIQSAADGENSIGANYYLPPTSTDSAPNLNGYTHLLIQNEIPLPSTLSYLTEAGRHSLTTVFNPSPMLSPSELRSFPWKFLSWLIVNEGELDDLLKAFDSATPAASTSSAEEDIEQRAKEGILSLHANSYFSKSTGIICTLGSKGILYFQPSSQAQPSKEQIHHLSAANLLNPLKDTTGAGDCFAGYFVAGLMAGEQIEDALRHCLTACAICVENEGAMESVPTIAEVQKRVS